MYNSWMSRVFFGQYNTMKAVSMCGKDLPAFGLGSMFTRLACILYT